MYQRLFRHLLICCLLALATAGSPAKPLRCIDTLATDCPWPEDDPEVIMPGLGPI